MEMLLTAVSTVSGVRRKRLMVNGQLDAGESNGFALFVLIGVGVVALCAFALSFNSMAAVALWAMFPQPLNYLVPVVLDLSIVMFTATAWRQEAIGQSTTLAWFFTALFTGLSAAGNFLHVFVESTLPLPIKICGAALSALMPLVIFAVTHIVGRVFLRRQPGTEEEKQARQEERRAAVLEADAAENERIERARHEAQRIAAEELRVERMRQRYLDAIESGKASSPGTVERKHFTEYIQYVVVAKANGKPGKARPFLPEVSLAVIQQAMNYRGPETSDVADSSRVQLSYDTSQ